MWTKIGLASIAGMSLGAVLGLLAGALVGGNFAANLELFGLRGYEATGIVGLGVGLVLGGWLGAHVARRRAR